MGGGSGAAGAAGSGGSDAATVYIQPPEPGVWEGMSFEERRRFMKQLVVPEMKLLFQGFDAERFGTFGCKTCHGSGVGAGTFALPNPDLPALKSSADQSEDEQRTADFMRNQVKPRMAELLGKPVAEVRCSTCHPAAQ